jgi:hypothetical protein
MKLLAGSLLICLALVGCGAPAPSDNYEPSSVESTQSGEDSNYVIRINITQDGVTKPVVCVYLSSQSISCDWDGYHKSDLPATSTPN